MQILVFAPVPVAATLPGAQVTMATWLSESGAGNIKVTAISFTRRGAQLTLTSDVPGETAADALARLETAGMSRLQIASKFAHAIGMTLRRCTIRVEAGSSAPVVFGGADPSTLAPGGYAAPPPMGGVPCVASGNVLVPNHPAGPGATAHAGAAAYRDRLLNHFRSLGNCVVTSDDGDIVELVADGFRGEVLKEKKAWERLQVSMLVSDRGAMSRVFLSVDGQFAPGIGSTKPPLASYRDMDAHYAASVQTYTKALLVQITKR